VGSAGRECGRELGSVGRECRQGVGEWGEVGREWWEGVVEGLSSDDVFHETSARYRAVDPSSGSKK